MDMKLLRIDSSARSSSVTRQLTSRFVDAWKAKHPHGRVIERDLSAISLPHITDEWLAAGVPAFERSAAQKKYLAISDALIEDLLAADTVLIGSPMHNFTVSWPLKAWLDQVVRIGKTFGYDKNGPQGLVKGKRVVVVTSRGGAYSSGSPLASFDFQEPYLRRILAFIGLTDVVFIHAENQLREQASSSLKGAIEEIERAIAEEVTPLRAP
jgi:FMN-dependent NADH-azoreductase